MMKRIFSLFCLFLMSLTLVSCRKAPDDGLLIDDRDLFPTETTESAAPESGQESSESEETAADPDAYFLDVPEASASEFPIQPMRTGDLPFAEDSSYLYFVNGASGTQYGFLTAADKATGELIPLCTKEGCTHSDLSCMALVVQNSASQIVGFSRIGKKLFYASAGGDSVDLYCVDLRTCLKEKTGRLSLQQFNESGAGFSGFANPGGCFYKDQYYFNMLQHKGIRFEENEDGYSWPVEYIIRTVAESVNLQDGEETSVLMNVYENFSAGELFVLPDEEKVYSAVLLMKRDFEQESAITAECGDSEQILYGFTLVVNVWDRESRSGKELFRDEVGFVPSSCVLHDGKIVMAGMEETDGEETAGLYELDLSSKKLSLLTRLPITSGIRSRIFFTGDSMLTFSGEQKTVSGTDLIELTIEQFDYKGKPQGKAVSEAELPFTDGYFRCLGCDGTWLYFYGVKQNSENGYAMAAGSALIAFPVNGGQAVVFGE